MIFLNPTTSRLELVYDVQPPSPEFSLARLTAFSLLFLVMLDLNPLTAEHMQGESNTFYTLYFNKRYCKCIFFWKRLSSSFYLKNEVLRMLTFQSNSCFCSSERRVQWTKSRIRGFISKSCWHSFLFIFVSYQVSSQCVTLTAWQQLYRMSNSYLLSRILFLPYISVEI